MSSLKTCIATFKGRMLHGDGDGGEEAARLDQCLDVVEETMRMRSEDVSLLQKALELCERERNEAVGYAEGLRMEVERLMHELEELKQRKEGSVGRKEEEGVVDEEVQKEGGGEEGDKEEDRVVVCGGDSLKEEECMERSKEEEEEKDPKEEEEGEGEGWKEEEEEEEGVSEREGRKEEQEEVGVEKVDSVTPNIATSLEDQVHVTGEDKISQSPIQNQSEDNACGRVGGVELASDGMEELGSTQPTSVATITGLE